MESVRIPELLAPVGGWQQLKAAVQNGADAVYMGGPLFNARIKAENFGYDNIEEAINYAHDRNVRVYITINTLIKDSELRKAFSYVNFLYGAGADAVILQDMGLARLVRKYLPDFDMHLSTQGTVYNKWAVELVKDMGFSRIVPAREMSLDEIDTFVGECHGGKTPCQVEIFVHGALCMCYSGQCHMSRVLGGGNGRSGNRGLCAQPCRLPYSDEEGKKRYLLSPGDLCTVDMIPQLCRTGVDSFKIEGRLKSPQYVAVVTSVYRKYLDMYKETGAVNVTEADRHKLAQIFSRGGSGHGYLEDNPGAKLLSGDSPKNEGIYVGKVVSAKKGSTLVDIQLNKADAPDYALSMGDGVEIRGKGTTGNIISYIRPVKNSILRIGDIKESVDTGDKVYKVTDKRLNAEAENSYNNDFSRKLGVSMKFFARCGEKPVLTMWEVKEGHNSESTINDSKCREAISIDNHVSKREEDAACIRVSGDFVTEKALKRPVEAERIKVQLAKLGDTVYNAVHIAIDIDDGIAIPISLINSMRRQAVEALLENKRSRCKGRKPLSEDDIAEISNKEELGREEFLMKHAEGMCGLFVYSRETMDAICREGLPKEIKATHLYVPLELYMDMDLRNKLRCVSEHEGVCTVPYVMDVTKGTTDKYLHENFTKIADSVRLSGIMLGNPGWIKKFREADVKVYGGSGLNVYNGQSLKAYTDMGIQVHEYSHEAEGYYSGNIPLMITEHPVTAQKFKDRKGAGYRVMKWHSGDKYLIFKEKTKTFGKDKRIMMYHIF